MFRSADELGRAFGAKSWSKPIDWDKEVLLVVERGECPTGGYTVDITGVSRPSPRALTVRVTTSDPAPGDFVAMVRTYPRAAAALDRRALEGVSQVTFVDGSGRTLDTIEVAR